MRVAAAVIISDGTVLICQRPDNDKFASLWEFPGGKIEEGESPEECIVRELQEELCLDVEPSEIFTETTYSYDDRVVELIFINCKIISGVMKLNAHKRVEWADLKYLEKYEFLPADVEVTRILKELL